MRQVLELEQERTSFAMKESEMSLKISELEEKWTSMCKELNDTKTEMKVLAARNQILEEKAAEYSQHNSVPFEAYRRLEVESESLKKTIRDLQVINSSQAKKLEAESKHINKFHNDQMRHEAHQNVRPDHSSSYTNNHKQHSQHVSPTHSDEERALTFQSTEHDLAPPHAQNTYPRLCP